MVWPVWPLIVPSTQSLSFSIMQSFSYPLRFSHPSPIYQFAAYANTCIYTFSSFTLRLLRGLRGQCDLCSMWLSRGPFASVG